MSEKIINKLSALLAPLEEQCKKVDQLTLNHKANKQLTDKAIFSSNLFSCQSDKLTPYFFETKKQLASLTYALAHKKDDISQLLIYKIEQQITAIYNAIQANNVRLSQATQLDLQKKLRYKNAVKKVVQSSHEMYQKLAEYHEFERRLMLMVNEKNLQRQQNTSQTINNTTDEVLILHQRLGRCRQAISKLEREIEISERSRI